MLLRKLVKAVKADSCLVFLLKSSNRFDKSATVERYLRGHKNEEGQSQEKEKKGKERERKENKGKEKGKEKGKKGIDNEKKGMTRKRKENQETP